MHSGPHGGAVVRGSRRSVPVGVGVAVSGVTYAAERQIRQLSNASVPVGPTVPSLLPPMSSEFLTPDSSDPRRQDRQQFRPWFQGTKLRFVVCGVWRHRQARGRCSNTKKEEWQYVNKLLEYENSRSFDLLTTVSASDEHFQFH